MLLTSIPGFMPQDPDKEAQEEKRRHDTYEDS